MKRLTAVVLLTLALTGCTEHRSCAKMKSLCGVGESTCKSTRDSVREQLGPEGLERLDSCVIGAESCAEATGCAAGAAVKAGVDGAKNFLNGLEKSMKKE